MATKSWQAAGRSRCFFQTRKADDLQNAESLKSKKAQEMTGGARGCAAIHAKSGRGEWKKSEACRDEPVAAGTVIFAEGGNASAPACVQQEGQCLRCQLFSDGKWMPEETASSVFCSL